MYLVKTRLGPSMIHGIGVFTEEFIPKGTIVLSKPWEFKPMIFNPMIQPGSLVRFLHPTDTSLRPGVQPSSLVGRIWEVVELHSPFGSPPGDQTLFPLRRVWIMREFRGVDEHMIWEHEVKPLHPLEALGLQAE